MHQLFVKVSKDDFLKNYYTSLTASYEGDSGVDLVFPYDITFEKYEVKFIDFGIACKMVDSDQTKSRPYQLVPRSSISKTPLGMANSIGIIDAGYRGNLIAAVRCFKDPRFQLPYTVKQGTKLFQVISYDGEPIVVKIVQELDETQRGSGGFGSSN